MALESLGKIGDEVVDAVKPAKSVAKKALSAMGDVADDWGWKGGKPGEITGSMWKRNLDNFNSGKIPMNEYEALLDDAYNQFERAAARGKPVGGRLSELQRLFGYGDSPVQKKLRNLEAEDRRGIAEHMLEDFYILEKSGVPRRLTGSLQPRLPELMRNKTYQSMLRNNTAAKDVGINDYAKTFKQTYGRYLSDLKPDQQETFLALLPEWTGSLDDLADAARGL